MKTFLSITTILLLIVIIIGGYIAFFQDTSKTPSFEKPNIEVGNKETPPQKQLNLDLINNGQAGQSKEACQETCDNSCEDKYDPKAAETEVKLAACNHNCQFVPIPPGPGLCWDLCEAEYDEAMENHNDDFDDCKDDCYDDC
jgi:hypothetical protein